MILTASQISNGVRSSHHPTDGTVPILLLQPRPKPGKPATWALYTSPSQSADGGSSVHPGTHDAIPPTNVPTTPALCWTPCTLPTSACLHFASSVHPGGVSTPTTPQAHHLLPTGSARPDANKHRIPRILPGHPNTLCVRFFQLCR